MSGQGVEMVLFLLVAADGQRDSATLVLVYRSRADRSLR